MIQHLAASKPGAWLLSRVLHRIDALVLRASGRRWTLTSLLAGVPVILVTTTGARSGKTRTVSLLPIHDGSGQDRFALIASNFGQKHFPAWYFNLRKYPRAICGLNRESGVYAAHEATGEEYERFWKAAVDTYFGYGLYERRAHRRIPIMVMEKMQVPATQK